MEPRENNNALYFIVGGLLVLAAVFGFMFYNGMLDQNVADLSPAAGYETPVETDTTRTDINVNDEGFESTVTQTEHRAAPAAE